MPPPRPLHAATSRSQTPDSLADHSSYLSALRQIDSIPVPDLAATLNNPAEDEANEANVSFLRTPIDPQDEWRAQNAEQHGGSTTTTTTG